MTTSNGSANPLYPFNWLDAMRANAWAPPSLPLFGDGVARNSWDRFPRADAFSRGDVYQIAHQKWLDDLMGYIEAQKER
jgi:hypothetical protein